MQMQDIEELFDRCLCPDDGIRYEKSEIGDWLKHNTTSPVSGKDMNPEKLKWDNSLAGIAEELKLPTAPVERIQFMASIML